MRRLVLHIGSPKCGSTFVQRVLKQNEDRLAHRNWLLPRLGEGHPGTDLEILTSTDEVWQTLSGKAHGANVFLSHEGLIGRAGQCRPFLDRARQEFDKITALCLVRPIEDIVYGTYSQLMKTRVRQFFESRDPYGGDFEAFVCREAEKRLFSRNLNTWRKLPINELVLRQHKDSVAFLTGLLGQDLDLEVPGKLVNKSLRIEDCDRIADRIRADADASFEDIQQMMRAAYRNSMTQAPDAGRTTERRDLIRTRLAREIDFVAEEFGLEV